MGGTNDKSPMGNTKRHIIRFENFIANGKPTRIDKVEHLLESFDLAFVIGKIISSIPEDKFDTIYENFLEMKTYMDIKKINEDKGRLKRLVGKQEDQYLSSADTLKLGRIIAGMEGLQKRDHVGIINFLGASCRIHHEIKNSYMNSLRSDMVNKNSTKANNAPQDDIPDEVQKVQPEVQSQAQVQPEAQVQAQSQVQAQVQAQVQDEEDEEKDKSKG